MRIGTKTYVLLLLLSITIAFERTAAQTTHSLNRSEPGLLGSTNKRSLTSIQDTLSLVGQWGWGECFAVTVRDHYLFVGNGLLLQVYDISDPASMKEVGEVNVGNSIFGLALSGNYAYVVPGFSIIDVSDLTDPRIVSSMGMPYLNGAIAVHGNYAFVGNVFGGIYTIDISNLSQPFVVNGYAMMRVAGAPYSIIVIDTILYVASSDFHTLPGIFNIADETSPVEVPSSFGYNGPLALQGHYLYLGAAWGADEFCIYDVTNLTNPRWVNGAYLQADPISITIRDTLAFVWEEYNGFEVADIADTSNIYVLAHVPYLYHSPPGEIGPVRASFDSSIAYIAGINGLWTVNVSSLPSVTSLSFLGTGWSSVPSIATDTLAHAFLAELYGGLKIVDFTDPSSPHLVSQYNPDEKVRDVAVSGDKAYVLCDSDMVILDVSDISTPKVVTKVVFGDTLNDNNGVGALGTMNVFGSTLYVARNSKKLYTIDVSNPSSPAVEHIESMSEAPLSLAKSGNYLYVATVDSGIQVFNIQASENPKQSGVINVGLLLGLNVSENNLYAMTECGFTCYKILDSTDLELTGCCSLPPGMVEGEIQSDSNIAYVCYNVYFMIIDVSSLPRIVDTIENAAFNSFGLNGNYVLASPGGNLLIMKNNLITKLHKSPATPQSFELYQNYPNPFNPSTKISFQIPKPGRVTLRVYDILGREMATLIDHNLQAGNYSVNFGSTKLASGVYFYSLRLNGEIITKKMEILK